MRPAFVLVLAVAGCPQPPRPAPAPAPAPAPVSTSASASPAASASSSASVIDTDGDGIADATDKCPNDAENYNGYQDEDGCPDKPNVVVVVTSNPPPVVLVQFPAGSAKPVPEANALLDEVATVMKSHPEIDLVQIEGHAAKNEPNALKLSQERAERVRAQLVAKGIDAKRLRAKGFAAHCTAPFKNVERRVEFKIVTTDGKPTGKDLGCAAATAAGVVSDP